MRVCAVSLPDIRIELARSAGAPAGAPLGIVIAEPPVTELTLLGNTRLDVVSSEALARGISPGSTIASARARSSDLAVRVLRPGAVREVLARLAEVAIAFGATVGFRCAGENDDDLPVGDTVLVDVTGCAHLHGPDLASGEAELARRLARVFIGLGHACAVAIADGPRVASMLAQVHGALASHPSHPTAVRAGASRIAVVPPGKSAEALAPLPVSMLPLAEIDVRWLAKIGVRTVSELRALPRSALASRLGARAKVVLSLADGDDRAPIIPHVPPEVPEETTSLEYGIEGTDALLFVTKTLTDRLGARLAGRAVATSRLELVLGLDHAMLEAGAERTLVVDAALPAPLSAAGDLLAALRTKIERVVLPAPVLTATLRAPVLVRKPEAALSLFDPVPKADLALPRLVAELAADLGEDAVGKLSLGDAWAPDERSAFVRLSAEPGRAARRKPRHLLSTVPEPTRIAREPVPVARDQLKIVRHLARLEATEWWRSTSVRDGDRGPSVDFVQATLPEEGVAWVEIDRRTGASRLRGWFD